MWGKNTPVAATRAYFDRVPVSTKLGTYRAYHFSASVFLLFTCSKVLLRKCRRVIAIAVLHVWLIR